MANLRARAALGFRAHSGWAAVVAVAGTLRAPEILDRRRIQIADSSIPGSKQPYHAAEELPFEKAKALLQRCEQGSRRLARKALGELVAEIRAKGYSISRCGLLLASGRPLPALPSILASHALIHTADGEHFRDALVHASEHRALAVSRLRERDLYAVAAARFRIGADALQGRINAIGKPLGPPWTQDQKLAALVAWLALAGG
jgi:hypothetical protein